MICGVCIHLHFYNCSECTAHLVQDSQQQISEIVFDETPNADIIELKITGQLDSIPDLSDATRKYMSLSKLTIEDVGLKNVREDQLAAFKGISNLDFSENKISELDADSFRELHDLKHITLRENSLEALPATIFRDNKKFNNLSLFNNKLKEVYGEAFKDLPALTYLQLSQNQVEVLPATIFRGTKKLKKIHFNHFFEPLLL